jgi:hypothetical protein
MPSIWSKHLFRYSAVFIAPCKKNTCRPRNTAHKCRAAQRTTYLNLIHETLGRALHPCGLFRLRELLVSDEVVPMLAPHVDVPAAITGTTFNLINVVVRGRLGLLVSRTATGCGRRHHRPLVQARGACRRRGPCPGRCWDSPLFGWGRSRDPVFLLHDVTRGRGPRSLLIPRRGACRGLC